eukprot:8487733-Lingulodinium_polyedra.AAC.1
MDRAMGRGCCRRVKCCPYAVGSNARVVALRAAAAGYGLAANGKRGRPRAATVPGRAHCTPTAGAAKSP